MPRRLLVALPAATLLLLAALMLWRTPDARDRRLAPESRPVEWFWRQRAYPDGRVDPAAYRRSLRQAADKDRAAELARRRGSKSALLNSVWEQKGPSNIGARVTDLAVHPTDPDICYAGMATGGVFKTLDGGASWTPVFDDQPVITVGAVALDPQRPDTVYVGTGEANAASLSFFGAGLFRSPDGGVTWEHLGLEETLYIARVVVDPTDGDRLYVAATGRLFGTDQDRGVFRTADGGRTWDRALALTDSTACIDLVMHPDDPRVLYAAMWERVRGLTYRRSGGPSSGIWRTGDGGESWRELTTGLPSGPDVGRIGLTICRDQPDVMYAIYVGADAEFAGVFRSTDGGETWARTSDAAMGPMFNGFGWYFGNVRVDPVDPDNVFALGVPLYRSTDGGQTWQENGVNMHVDHHAMAFCPSLPSRVYAGNDGGVYRSNSSGLIWSKLYEQPTNQFYAIEIDPQDPTRLYGGTQDNGTLRTPDGGVDTWERIFGGDGFTTIVDPTDHRVIYCEYQFGILVKSVDGGLNFDGAMNGIDLNDRRNWHTPVVMDPTDPQTLYYGSQRVYRSRNGAETWIPISDDLTGGDQGANFGTVTTIAVAPSSPASLYAGTDDGRVWSYRPLDGGWRDISAGLPQRWVTRVAVDPADRDIVYVTHSGLRWDDPQSHVFRSADGGSTWLDIGQDLPDSPVNAILVDPDHPEALYVATDVGVYHSWDTGETWDPLGLGLPRAPVLDLDFHRPTRLLAAGTHGRSLFTVTAPEETTQVEEPPPSPLVTLAAAPNPFNAGTELSFNVPTGGETRIDIFDVRGRRVGRPISDTYEAGLQRIRWNARDGDGRDLSSGVYLARLTTPTGTATIKLLLAR